MERAGSMSEEKTDDDKERSGDGQIAKGSHDFFWVLDDEGE